MSALDPLWDSRFNGSQIPLEAFVSANDTQADTLKISSILAAAGRHLPVIYPQRLRFHKHLGAGSCFRVSCEIYTGEEKHPSLELVAVKYIRLPKSGSDTGPFYDGVMRELRVLTHPPLRNHECIIEILAYGWSISPEVGFHPYLVVEYAEHGTLFEYLQRITPPVDQCRELALDVAVGLQALHHSDIIHGDLKPDNVLIFDCAGQRPQVAKLADFGASIFEVDFNNGPVSYRGTARYNAPDQEGRLGSEARKAAQTKEGFYKADIFSMGILIWEVMKDGDEFWEPEWLVNGETELQFLERICEMEEDGILKRARSFCENRFRHLNQPDIERAIMNAFAVTLRDKATLRADIDLLVDLLAYEVSKARPKPQYPRVRVLPISNDHANMSQLEATFEQARLPIIKNVASIDRKARRRMKMGGGSVLTETSKPAVNVFQEAEKIVRARAREHFLINPATKTLQSPTEPSGEVNSLSVIPKRELAPTLSSFRQQNLDMFQIFSTAVFPPWSIQCSIFDELKAQTRGSSLTSESADAYFHLSMCYLNGFGVEPAASEVLYNLRKALYSNSIARSIYRRVEMAYDEQAEVKFDYTTVVDDQLEHLVSDPFYFSHRLRLHQRSLSQSTRQRLWKCDSVDFMLSNSSSLDSFFQRHDCHQPCISTDTPGIIARRNNLLELVAEAGDATVVKRLIGDRTWSDKELACALTKACEHGHFATAEFLAHHCPHFQDEEHSPSPLHWLVMFDQDEAKQLASLLILGSSHHVESANGICRGMVNAMPSPGSEPYTLPDHCLQLTGSPLHWAVGARHLALVTVLIELGASIHLRWSYNRKLASDLSSHQRPDLTPFELAIAWHLPEICEVLWKATPSSHQANLLKSSATFHSIGQHALPFLRYIIHGSKHVQALRDTIGMLQSWGFDAQYKNQQEEPALMAALADPDQEIYVLQGLMSISDCKEETTLSGKNAVTLVAATSSRRRYSAQRLLLAMERVTNINDLDHSGRNALHYFAAENNDRLCDVLLQSRTLDINKRNAHGETAAHIAATLNSGAILKLLVRKGADIEIFDSNKHTPLTLAILHRQKEAIQILVKAGADVSLGNRDRSPKTSALHAAVSGPNSLDSIFCYLLENFPEFRDPWLLDLVDEHGWTPLHRAAYFGDYQAVAALLNYGANSEAQTSSGYRMAQGQTALEITDNRLKRMLDIDQVPDHSQIRQLRLQEVRSILTQKRSS